MYGKFRIKLERDFSRIDLKGGSGYIEKKLPIYVVKKDDVDNYFMAHLVYIRFDDGYWSFYGAESVKTGEFVPADKLLNFAFFKAHFSFDIFCLCDYDKEFHKGPGDTNYTFVLKPSFGLNEWEKDTDNKETYIMDIAFAESFEEFDIPQGRLERNIKDGACLPIKVK